MIVSDLPPIFIRIMAFVFGAIWGSFFNVAIYRWPRDMSVVSPPSHCPHCGAAVPGYRNIPILNYIFSRGRASCCGAKLTSRYLWVEVLGGILCVAVAERYLVDADHAMALSDAGLQFIFFFAFVSGLLIATFVDLEWMEIPDEVSIGGTALGLATFMYRPDGPPAEDLILGAGAGYLLVHILLVWCWERLTGRRGMGEGDAKLLMYIGAFLGWQGALFALVAGAFQGVFVTLLSMLAPRRPTPVAETNPSATNEDNSDERPAISEDSDSNASVSATDTLTTDDGVKARLKDEGRLLEVVDPRERLLFVWESSVEADALKRAIPFGPFLAVAALEYLFFGPQLITLYLDFFGV